MPDLAHLAAFAIAALTIALIPGPGLLYVLARSLGAAYLVWLGIRALRSSAPAAELDRVDAAPGALRQGIVTEALNPKTALFFLTFLPQFCQPENGPLWIQLVVLGTFSVALNTLVDVVVALGAGRVSEWLRTRPKAWRRQQVATGSILVGLGVYAAASGHRAE